jgi:hypothetical protein
MRIADEIGAPVSHRRVRHGHAQPMAAVSAEPDATQDVVRTRRILVDQYVMYAAIGLSTGAALCGLDMESSVTI